jgi:multiple sugar transport system substrate-binding protein
LDAPPTTWRQVIDLAHDGRVLWPVKPVDALMSFFTLCANLGAPCARGDRLCDPQIARQALAAMHQLANLLPTECRTMNPIQVLDRMSAADHDRIAYCPLLYGYTNYARDGYAPHRIEFADIPALGHAGPRGSTLGGTGIAVSARCRHLDLAVEYAFWIAGAECQKTLYFDAGGQPGNAAAWDDGHCNAVTHNFFSRTRATLQNSYIRPRYDGYMEFQDRGGERINRFLQSGHDIDRVIDELEALYQSTMEATRR